MSRTEVKALIAALALEATRARLARGQATMYDLVHALRRESRSRRECARMCAAQRLSASVRIAKHKRFFVDE